MPLTKSIGTAFVQQEVFARKGLPVFSRRRFNGLGKINQPFRGLRPAVEHDVFNDRQKVLGDLVIDGDLACVDNAHIHASFNGVI